MSSRMRSGGRCCSVTVTPTDYGLDPVSGTLVGLGDPASGVALAGTAVIATGLAALALLVGRSAVGGPGPARVVGAG